MPGTSRKGTPDQESAAKPAAVHTGGAGGRSRRSSGAPAPNLGDEAPTRLVAVVVDPMPLFRAGAVAALSSSGIAVAGEAANVAQGVELAQKARAHTLLLGGATVSEAREAVAALPSCAVIALLAQPTRADLVEMLGAGVAGLAMSSLTPEELVATVQSASDGLGGPDRASSAPVIVPLPVAASGSPGPAAHAEGGTLPVLTRKEHDVLAELARGASNKRIAEALYVTPATVKTHLAHIYGKLGARSRREAVSRALATGLLR